MAYRYERSWPNGSVIEMQGNPMPGGGYVTTFTDITHFKEIERKLQEVNETLEQRVLQRTRELSDAIREVEKARQSAEAANLSKTRFLAAASHDLLQPMNAARLFISILRAAAGTGSATRPNWSNASTAASPRRKNCSAPCSTSPSWIQGMYRPEPEAISVEDLFEQLRRRFKALAANRGLQLRVHPM